MKLRTQFVFIYLLTGILAVFSCQNSDVKPLRSEAAFLPYVDKFIAEAKKRNKTFDFDGLTIDFGHLLPRAGAQADRPNRRITVDSTSWRISSADWKEQAMLHEFGHYFLDRDHLLEAMPNGEARSMMEGNPWASRMVYRGMRKSYYIDELFDPNTPIPYWGESTFVPSMPTNRELIGNFTFGDAKKWKNLLDIFGDGASIVNGSLVFKQKNDNPIVLNIDSLLTTVPAGISVKKTKNYEVTISYSIDKGGVLVSWSGTDNSRAKPENFYRFWFGSEDRTNNAAIDVETSRLDLTVNNLPTNQLTLKRYNNFQSFWLNGKLLFYADVLNPDSSADNWTVLLQTLDQGTMFKINSITVSRIN